MYYINAISSISHQPTFGEENISLNLKQLDKDSSLITPNYKEFINPGSLRRMSNILRMSVACSSVCVDSVKDIDAIVVGTGLGCLTDTHKFLNNFVTIESLIPPTSFIQSTHNTIAGLISITLKKNSYNITHTQNTVSFELALQDAMLLLDEGAENILLGAADENIQYLDNIASKLGAKEGTRLTSGTTFLILSKTENENTIASIKACESYFNSDESTLDKFLKDNNTSKSNLDEIIYSTPFNEITNNEFESGIDISKYAGTYPTNSAFGLHLAANKIKSGAAKQILIHNRLNKTNLGLILIEQV